MKRATELLALAVLASASLAGARTPQDDPAVRDLPKAFANDWDQHDGHRLAQIMAADVDFVTVGATWFGGRADLEKYHTQLLTGRFKESVITPLDTAVRFIRPELAEKRNGTWLVVAAQNTNSGSVAPEVGDIKPPIGVPRSEP